MEEKQQPQIVQHDLSPEAKETIVSVAKFGIKVWVVMAIVGMVFLLVVGVLFYRFFFSPILSQQKDAQQNMDKRMEEFDQKVQNDSMMFEEKVMQEFNTGTPSSQSN